MIGTINSEYTNHSFVECLLAPLIKLTTNPTTSIWGVRFALCQAHKIHHGCTRCYNYSNNVQASTAVCQQAWLQREVTNTSTAGWCLLAASPEASDLSRTYHVGTCVQQVWLCLTELQDGS